MNDARKRLDESVAQWRGEVDRGERLEGRLSDLESVLADADRDRQLVEAVRTSARDESTRNGGAINMRGDASPCFRNDILNAHERIYGTPCTAKEPR